MSDYPKIVDRNGRPITLTSAQKNEIYRNAKRIKEQLSDKMCTRNECARATPENVNKMLNSEFKSSKQMDVYVKSMQAIGADPKDADVERIRRR